MSRRRLLSFVVVAIGLGLLPGAELLVGAARAEAGHASAVPLEVLVHIQDEGDRTVAAGQWAGTRGEGRQIEGFQVTLHSSERLGVRCMAHLMNSGDTGWTSGFVGTRGQLRRLEGFACQLTGLDAGFYDLRYRAHIENVGDTETFSNGAFCGTRGLSTRVEALQVWVERRTVPRSDVAVDILVHVVGVGDRTVSAGQWGGDRGNAPLGGFQVHLRDAPGLGVQCMARLHGSGDTSWTDGFVGLRRQSRAIQGFACRLTGEHAQDYHIIYRAHVRGGAEIQPAADGALCGGREQSEPLDEIQLWVTQRDAS